MVLTYSMVLNRLDQLNERERQVRDFYKPLPGLPREKPWPRRHRFADKLEVEDVVKTMGKGDENWDGDLIGVDEVEDHSISKADDQHSSHISRPATVGSGMDRRTSGAEDFQSMSSGLPGLTGSWQTRPSTSLGPSRESRKIENYAVKTEKQLRKAVDDELNSRRDKMREMLQKEVGLVADEASEGQESGTARVEPLFRPPGRVAQVHRKPTVHKTGTAPSKELAVYETAGMHWSGGPTFQALGEGVARERLTQEYGEELKDMEEHVEREAERRQQAQALSSRRSQGEEDEEASEDGAEEEQEALDGDYSTWRWRKTLVGDHDDPEQRDFYFAQIRVDPKQVGQELSAARFVVKVTDTTLHSQPEFTFPSALASDPSGLLLFPRKEPLDRTVVKTSVLSPADDLPWVSDPRQLLGHSLRIQVFLRSPDFTRGPLLSERSLHYRPPLDAYHPPASAPVNLLPPPGGSALFPPPPRAAHRPETAPAQSPGTAHRLPLRGSGGAGSPGRGGGRGAVVRWNAWAAEGGAPGGGEEGDGGGQEEGEEGGEEKKGEEAGAGEGEGKVGAESSEEGLSPLAKKKRELAKMRQQMRASLQQTQSKMMASTPTTAGGAGAGTAAAAAPMMVSRAGVVSAGPVRRQPSGGSPKAAKSPAARPVSQQGAR